MAPRATQVNPPHQAWTGTHMHEHIDPDRRGGNGSGLHQHMHAHLNDDDHTRHSHAAVQAGKSADVPTPALDIVAKSRTLIDGVNTLLAHGRLHKAADEMHRLAVTSDSLIGASKALDYRRKAELATDPMDRRSYTELAKQAEAGAL